MNGPTLSPTFVHSLATFDHPRGTLSRSRGASDRSTAVGEWATFTVKFGTGSGGTTVTSVEETTAKKAA